MQRISSYAAPVRVVLFLLCLSMIWLPIAIPVYLIWGDRTSAILAILLYVLFVTLIYFWGTRVEHQPQPFTYYGLEFSRASWLEFFAGLGLGFVSLGLLMLLETGLGWLSWQVGVNWQAAILPGMLTGIGVGFAEELLFRGWLLTELEKDYGEKRSLWLNSIIFATLHFLKPLEVIFATWVQFPGLVLLGMDLVWAKRLGNSRLGLAIGLHGGLVWGYYVVNTTHWIKSNQVVAAWVTGIDGNPLAGVMGLLFLGAIAGFLKLRSRKNQ